MGRFINKVLVAALLLVLASPAAAQVDRFSLPDAMALEDGGTIGGAKWHCYYLYPTTPDGDVVAGTDLDRVMVRKAFTVTNVYAHVDVTGTTDAVTIDLNEAGTTIISTKLTVDASENDSSTAATAAVISDSAIAANAVLNVDVDDQDGGNTAAGLEVAVCGYHS